VVLNHKLNNGSFGEVEIHADRVLVPICNNGIAVYQVTKNGKAK
jgi:hypothetical protein